MDRAGKIKMCRDLVRWAGDDHLQSIENTPMPIPDYRLAKSSFQQLEKAINIILDIVGDEQEGGE
jgi:hypothetical protein